MNINTITQAIATTMQQIAEAAQQGNLSLVESLTKKASELKAIQNQAAALENRLVALSNGPKTGNSSHDQTPALRELPVTVTIGMIRQNLLTLTDAVKRRSIGIGEKLVVETPNGEQFETVLLEIGNKLQERGRIGKFYRDFGVQDGDIVLLREITPGRWRLLKK
jgi:hypothetical protein